MNTRRAELKKQEVKAFYKQRQRLYRLMWICRLMIAAGLTGIGVGLVALMQGV